MFNPNQSILELKVFRWTFFSLLISAFISVILIVKSSPLQFSSHYVGFNHFFTVFRFPLAILATIIPAVALIATNHRSEQTREQIRLTNSQNNFTNYYKHIEEFEKFSAKITVKSDLFHYLFDSRFLHSVLFNRAKDGNYAPNEEFISMFVDYSYKMLLLISSPKSNENEKIDAICEFMLKQELFHKKHEISMPSWSGSRTVTNENIPNSVFEILMSIVELLMVFRALIRFDTSYKDSPEMSKLISLDLSSLNNSSTYDLSGVDFNSLHMQLSAV